MTLDVLVSQGSLGHVPQVSSTISASFLNDPVHTYFLNTINPKDRLRLFESCHASLITAAALNSGELVEAGNFDAVSVW